MKNLQFRAYHTETKQMYDVISFTKHFVKFKNRGNTFEWERKGFKPLMQYTGKRDKKRRKIYEGDLLQTNGRRGPCKWRAVFGMSSYCNGFHFESVIGSQSSVHNAVWEEGVVVGNIYENPELLNP